MDVLERIIATYRHMIPVDCETALAIARGASVAEICASAERDGLHDLAAALFSADAEERQSADGAIDADPTLRDDIAGILADHARRLPPTSETARLIKTGTRLELIAQAAVAEGLDELVAVLFEAGQERT